QAHYVVAARAGIRSQDQFRRYRCDCRSGTRSVPVGNAAGAILFRATALRGGARSLGARNLGGASHYRDRGDQGDRSSSRERSAPWTALGERNRRRGRRGGGGRSRLTPAFPSAVE